MEFAFWTATIWVVYAFVGYPILALILGRVLDRHVPKEDIYPSVTVVIAAYNEAAHIVETVQNKLNQDYPDDLLSVIVVSDESDDGTDELVKGIGDPRVTLIRQSPRQGKTSGLNLAMQSVESDVVVFSDANSRYSNDAVAKLVRNFSSDDVGYVTGKMIYSSPESNAVGDGCSSYMRFENLLREAETRVGSVVGVDGGIDVVRRSAYQEMNADQLPDFVLPLLVRKQGLRVVYEPDARLVEETLDDGGAEFRMRVRVGLRAIWALHDLAELLNPLRYGLFALQLWSHKLLRYLAIVPLMMLPILSYLLMSEHWFYATAFWGQLVVYALAYSATLTKSPNAVQSLPYYFTLINIASGLAIWKFLRGEKQVIWQPRLGG